MARSLLVDVSSCVRAEFFVDVKKMKYDVTVCSIGGNWCHVSRGDDLSSNLWIEEIVMS